MSAGSLWNLLSEPWQACAELSWEAYCVGSLPIAAVVVDEVGEVVSSGRNRLYERPTPPHLAGHPLAHAEMNALVNFDYEQHDPYMSILYTTTEFYSSLKHRACVTQVSSDSVSAKSCFTEWERL